MNGGEDRNLFRSYLDEDLRSLTILVERQKCLVKANVLDSVSREMFGSDEEFISVVRRFRELKEVEKKKASLKKSITLWRLLIKFDMSSCHFEEALTSIGLLEQVNLLKQLAGLYFIARDTDYLNVILEKRSKILGVMNN